MWQLVESKEQREDLGFPFPKGKKIPSPHLCGCTPRPHFIEEIPVEKAHGTSEATSTF